MKKHVRLSQTATKKSVHISVGYKVFMDKWNYTFECYIVNIMLQKFFSTIQKEKKDF